MAKQKRTPWWRTGWFAAVSAMLGTVGGGAVGLWKFTDSIATKPYVDERVDSNRKYTDDQVGRAIERANQHSDQNRAAMEIKIERVDGKQDSLMEVLKLVREQQLQDRQERRR